MSTTDPSSTRPISLEELLQRNEPQLLPQLSSKDLTRLYWKYQGLKKQLERDTIFWQSTNDNLRLAYERLDEKEQELAHAYGIIRDDLEVARQVQTALLPRMFANMTAELELGIYQRQLNSVGGDYYDFFRTPNDRYAIGVFDISGHGVSAALVMAFLKAQFMTIMERLDTPQGIVEWVNRISYDFLREVRKYATVSFVTFEPSTIRYVCGGGYGLLVHCEKQFVLEKRNHFLGLRLKPYHEDQLPFEKGDLLALYTDGIVEAQDSKGHDYTVRRLNELIVANRHLAPQQIVDLCLKDYESFRAADTDDITLLVIRKKA